MHSSPRKSSSIHSIRGWMILSVLMGFLISSSALGEPPGTSKPAPELIPEILYWESVKGEPPRPLFISAAKAFLPNGEPDTSILDENVVSHLKNNVLNLGPGECVPGPRWSHSLPPRHWGGFQSIQADADFVVLATVKDAKKGVAGFSPGTLFRIESQQWLKGEPQWDEKYFFMPLGEMEFAGRQICAVDDEYPEPPEIGWRVLISFEDTWINRNRPILRIHPPQLIVLPPTGNVLLPKRLKRFQPEWLEKDGTEVLRSVESKMVEDP